MLIPFNAFNGINDGDIGWDSHEGEVGNWSSNGVDALGTDDVHL